MAIFFSLILFILSSVWIYVWRHLVLSAKLPPLAQNILLVFFILGFAIQFLRWFKKEQFEKSPLLLFLTYFALGLMTHLFFGTAAKDLIVVATYYLSGKTISLYSHIPLINGITFSLCFIANLWGMRTALVGPIIRNVEITLKDWPKSQDGYRIVQISDLHVGPMIGKKYVENVVQKTLALKPDFIALTGDMGDGEASQLTDELEPLRKLHARDGVYYVTGNHEYYWKGDQWEKKVRELGITHFHNAGKIISLPEKNIWVAGIPDHTCTRFFPDQKPDAKLAAPPIEYQAALKIMLAHQPKSCFTVEEAGFDIMLCGHTHWGQFFPISLLVGWFNPYHKSLNLHKQMWVYVNAGTGFWGPPLRLGVPSEITNIILKAE